MVNGVSVKWKLLPSYGRSLLNLVLTESTNNIIIETIGLSRNNEPIILKKNVGEVLALKLPNAKIISIIDLQKVFDKTEIKNGVLNATISNNQGHHTFILEVLINKLIQKQIVHLEITDKILLAKEKDLNSSEIPPNPQWNCININTFFNADIRTIYLQKYLSPRSNTVSARN